MAVVHKNFADYYNSLVSRVPTHHELLLRLCREETGERKAIEEQLSHALADLMHERGVMIAERKEIERNPTLKFEPSLTRLITLGMRQTNLELIRQRQQNPLVRQQPLIRAFPRAKYFTLLKEEEELRTWLSGVEHRLREKVEKECSHSWFLLVCLRQLVDHENEVRERIQQTEADQRVVIRRGVFRYAPPEFFRRQCVERTKGPVKEKTFEEEHLDSRAVVEAEELEEWKCMLRWLFDMYGVRLYSTSRCETAERYFIEEEEQKELWEKTLECTRESYGPYGKLTATIAWHGTSCTPLMRMLTCLPEKIREAAEAKAREANKYPPVHESSAESSRSVTPRQEVEEHEELDEADIPKEASTGSSPKKPASEDAGGQVAAEGVEDATEQSAEQAEDATEQPDEHEELDEADIPKEASTGSSPKKPASEDAGEQVAAEGVEDATEQPAEQAEDATEQPAEQAEDATEQPAEQAEDAGEQVAAEGVEDATEEPGEQAEDATEQSAEQAEDATEQPDEHEELDEADIPKEVSTGSSPKKPASEDAGEQVAAEGVEDATEQPAEEVAQETAAEQTDEHEELDEADIPKEASTGSSPKKPASEDATEQPAEEAEDATEQPTGEGDA